MCAGHSVSPTAFDRILTTQSAGPNRRSTSEETLTVKVDASVVRLVADLAQLHLDPADLEEQIASMNRILGLVESMNSVDTDNVEPMANPLDATQRLREDVVTEADTSASFQEVAPETEANLYLVPRYVE